MDERSIKNAMNEDMLPYLACTPTIDCDHPTIVDYATGNAGDSPDPVDQAVRLYYAVRDDIRYDPYTLDLSVEGLRASTTLRARRGWCVAKAILLAAC
ncbi:MAG TPA: transglutaminase family protein, partial [Deltaproteobacteria bacterium]|nr:transglutaminase family protein [Deltaproteobacteria bacterium]